MIFPIFYFLSSENNFNFISSLKIPYTPSPHLVSRALRKSWIFSFYFLFHVEKEDSLAETRNRKLTASACFHFYAVVA